MEIKNLQKTNSTKIQTKLSFAKTRCLKLNLHIFQPYIAVLFHIHKIHFTDIHFFEVQIITEGNCIMELDGGRRIEMKKGQFIVFPPHIKHRVVFESENYSKLLFGYNISAKDSKKTDFYCLSDYKLKNIRAYRCSKNIKSITENIFSLSLKMPYKYMTAITHNLISSLIEIHGTVSGGKNLDKEIPYSDKRVGKAIQFIRQNISADMTVSHVSAYIHISPKQFARIFTAETGTSPGEYIKTCRIEKIRNLLETPELTLKEIADTLNYTDVSSLIKAYKRVEGITPTQQRINIFKNS